MVDREFLIQLTCKLYRATLLFPKKEPLRYKAREVADDVLANFITLEGAYAQNPGKFAGLIPNKAQELAFIVEKDLGVLAGYFEVAKWQNWASYFDIAELQQGYEQIVGYLKEREEAFVEIKRREKQPVLFGASSPQTTSVAAKEVSEDQATDKLDPRKEKILEVLRERGKVQVGEVNKILTSVSKRTLRRDFQSLLSKGIIERIGERSSTFYKMKS